MWTWKWFEKKENFFKEVVRFWKKNTKSIIWTLFSYHPTGPCQILSFGFLFFLHFTHQFFQFWLLLCLQHSLKKREKKNQQKLISYVRGSHCTLFRDGTNIPQVPDDHVVKCMHASKFQPSRMPFWISGKFQVSLDIWERADHFLEGQKVTTDISALNSVPNWRIRWVQFSFSPFF